MQAGDKSEEEQILQVFSFTESVMNQFTQLSTSCLLVLVLLVLESMTTLHNDWEGRSPKSFD